MKKLNFNFIIFFSILFFCHPLFSAEAKLPAGMVVTEQKLATQVGVSILEKGGNAVDAAVAVGYALAVVNPCCGNIGGGGFMIIHLRNGKNIFINFREKAPLAAKENLFLDQHGNIIPDKSTQGYLAIGVPGTVLGLETALKKYGTMTREQVMSPAIHLAKEGFIVTDYQATQFRKYLPYGKNQTNIQKIFFNHSEPLKSGERLTQTELGETLTQISKRGSDYFYKGPIAKEIVAAAEQHGGILTLKDFSDYSVEELKPIVCTYRGFTIISSPPPSSGGVALCEMTNILEAYPLQRFGNQSPQSIHDIVEAMRFSFEDRNNKLRDPNFGINPIKELTSKDYARKLREKIPRNKATTQTLQIKVPRESTNTTHFSVVDKKGNAVAVTYTLNSYFGAQVIADDTGFFLNDEMDDFTSEPGKPNQFGLIQGNVNLIQPGKRPLSSMMPTIVLKNQKVFLVLGSPGGPRIITSVLLTLINIIDFKKSLEEAVSAPRYHHQWLPDRIDTEPHTFSENVTKKLSQMGYQVNPMESEWGAVEAIMIDSQKNQIIGASDNRRNDGQALATS